MANEDNVQSAPKVTVAGSWDELQFRRDMGEQGIYKVAIIALAVGVVTLSVAIVATVFIVKFLST
jgi:hypothetical protein